MTYEFVGPPVLYLWFILQAVERVGVSAEWIFSYLTNAGCYGKIEATAKKLVALL